MAQSSVLVVSIDSQASAVWWADRVGDNLPFDFTQAHDEEPDQLRKLAGRGARIIVVVNQKGGVGKTTTAVNLAATLQDTLESDGVGYRHIVIDTPGKLKLDQDHALERLAEDEPQLIAALDIADVVLVPITPEPLSYDATRRTIEMLVKPRGKNYRVIVNNWDPRDGTADRDETIAYVEAMRWSRTKTVIRRYKLHTRASADGQVVTNYPKNRVAMEARHDFLRLALEVGEI